MEFNISAPGPWALRIAAGRDQQLIAGGLAPARNDTCTWSM